MVPFMAHWRNTVQLWDVSVSFPLHPLPCAHIKQVFTEIVIL